MFTFPKRRSRSLIAGAAIATLALSAAAVSSATSEAVPSAVTAGDGLGEARANVRAHIKPPARIGPNVPIRKAIPTGKTVVYIDCGVTGCVFTGNALAQAAKVLGWTVKRIAVQPTPQSIQGGFDAAIRMKPDAVVADGFPIVAFSRQLAELKKLGIPYLSINGTDPPAPDKGLIAQLVGVSTISQATRLVADKTIVDAGGKGQIGVIGFPSYPIVALYTKAYTDQIKKNCPACSTKTLDLVATDIGTTAASKITAFLRANPGIKHLFFSYDDLANGLSTAVKNAGIAMPKVYSWSLGAQGIAGLRSGERTAGVPQDYAMQGWQIADTLARHFTGMSLAPDYRWGGFMIWSKDYKNVPPASAGPAPPTIKTYQQQFKKLWGK